MKTIFFIAINFNNSVYTLTYVKNINELLSPDLAVKIVIVDNDSCIDDYKILQQELKDISNVSLIRNEKNVGYFKGLNIGIKSVQREPEDILIVGNNDLQFKQDFLIELEKIKYDSKVLVIAPNVITKDGYHQNPHYVDKITAKRKFLFKVYYSNYYIARTMMWVSAKFVKKRDKSSALYEKECYIYQGIGACYILTCHFFSFYDKLDDQVFMWGEEALLANQLLKVEGKMLYSPKIVVYHAEGVSVKKLLAIKAYNMSKESWKIYGQSLP